MVSDRREGEEGGFIRDPLLLLEERPFGGNSAISHIPHAPSLPSPFLSCPPYWDFDLCVNAAFFTLFRPELEKVPRGETGKEGMPGA